ncbi:monooxygenase [Shewanella sp. UCD-KL12]|uniref:monooxygenase n=1 Tax=Shewanella sp. UCD-KL12 TaxID=1917163 RepID=UPI0009708AC6|nr:monooxygenase [Shewanella sp. UCD-KL12]
MKKLLQVDFNFTGPYGDEMAEQMLELAKSINEEPGMIWKIWTENEALQLGGGIYLFEDESSAQDYLKMHSARLKKMGIENIKGTVFDINTALSIVNQAPLLPV